MFWRCISASKFTSACLPTLATVEVAPAVGTSAARLCFEAAAGASADGLRFGGGGKDSMLPLPPLSSLLSSSSSPSSSTILIGRR
eukprot:4032362-Pleurochrysis_carterae.AAC.1